VAQRLLALVVVGGARAARRRQVVVVGHPVDELRALSDKRAPFGHHGVELRAVAGGQHHDLVDAHVDAGIVHRLGHLLRGKRDALAHLDCGGVVIDAEGNEIHLPASKRLKNQWNFLKLPRILPIHGGKNIEWVKRTGHARRYCCAARRPPCGFE
jgi:hypothetical protein